MMRVVAGWQSGDDDVMMMTMMVDVAWGWQQWVFSWETATYGKIRADDDLHDLRSVEAEFPAIVINDAFAPKDALLCESQVSTPVNNEIDFRISFDESDDEDYTIICDKNSFSYKMISVNKTDSENNNEKAGVPPFPPPKPTISYVDDLDFFKDFENEFPAIFYNVAQTSKSDYLAQQTLSPQHNNEYVLNDETSLSEYDKVGQNVLYFNDLFPFNVIYPNDLKSDEDNDNNEIDIIQSSEGNLNTHRSNMLMKTSRDKMDKIFDEESFVLELNVNIVTWIYLFNGMLLCFIMNLYVSFGIPFDPKRYYKDGDCTLMLRRPRTFSVVTDFVFLEDTDAYHDEGMGEVIVGEPFLREVRIKARRFDGMITIYNGDDEVTYQMVRSHPRFKHHTNEQCNKKPTITEVPAGSVVPTGKDSSIVSTGSTKVIPAGSTILVLQEKDRKRSKRKHYDSSSCLLCENKIAVQRETKARTILLQSLPEDHMADFHHLDDARDIWLAVKARFGGNDESKKMRKSMLKQEFSEFRVAITLKTKGGLDYLSFDDLYNKLRTLEIDVKGGSSYDSRGTSAPTHSAFISAASTNSKMSYPNQSHSTTFTSTSSSHTASSNVMENVLHSFVAESDPQQQITYEDFDQIGKLDLEELDIKWQMAMLSVRINRFEKKAGRKMKFNNKDAARFDKKRSMYKCSELGHLPRECTGKQLDSKARYSSFKLKELDKTEEPKALLSVDSMLNWSDHEGEDVESGAAQVYGMIAGAEEDAADNAAEEDAADNAADDVADDVSNAAAEFALIGFGETFGSDEVFDPSAPSIFDTTPEDVVEKPLYDMFVTAVGMHAVPPHITGTFMPPSNNPDLDDTQFTYGVKSSSSKTKEPLASAPSSVAFQTLSEIADPQPSSTNDTSSFSFKENVKPPRNFYNKSEVRSKSLCKRKSFGFKTCFVCGSKFHLIKDCNFYEKQLELHNKPLWNNVTHIPLFVPKAASVPAGSRNKPTSVPAGSRNKPTSVPTGSVTGPSG
ncbi:hypothetical protein Tco_0086350 [Tanacetum coccineum]